MGVGTSVGMGHIGPSRVGAGTGGLPGGGILPLGDRIVVRFRPIEGGLLVARADPKGYLGRARALRLHHLPGTEREEDQQPGEEYIPTLAGRAAPIRTLVMGGGTEFAGGANRDWTYGWALSF